MVKPTKYLRKEAVKAEIAAGQIDDPEISTELLAMAHAYRSQADILKKNKKDDKKRRAEKLVKISAKTSAKTSHDH